MADQPTTPCTLCGTPTPMLGTKKCDRCWELDIHIRHDVDLAKKILAQLEAPLEDGQPAGCDEYISWEHSDKDVLLDGMFSLAQLEQIVAHMRLRTP